MKKLSCIIPCYNSGEVLYDVVKDVREVFKKEYSSYEYEIILVNDGSPKNIDALLNKIKNDIDNVKVIELSKNFGQQNAIMCGLNNASGDVIVVMDDDGQTPAKEIPKLVNSLGKDVDVAYAKYKHKKHSFFRNFGSKVNDWMLIWLLGKPKKLYISSFFAMKSYVKDEMIKYTNTYPYLMGLVLRITNKIINIECDHNEREDGKSGYTIKKLIKLWINGLTNFSVKPLHLSLLFSFGFSLFAVILLIYLIIVKLTANTAPIGWTSVIVVLLFIGAVLSFLMGLIGEYVGRIFICINKIPQYVERKDNDREV